MKNRIFALITALFISAGISRADVIDWGFEIIQTPTSSFDSAGVALDSSYTFYLGGFDDFLPSATRANYSDWISHWSTLDSTTFDDGANNWFTGSSNITDNLTFDAGDHAYIWGTNGALGDANAEVILLTSVNWLYPSAQPTDPDVSEFLLSDVNLTAVIGAVNSNYTGQESGISNNLGSFDIQTEAVPEPGGVILLGFGLTCLLFRRKTRQPA
ncbi:PEP-CTERM sorting domain-containing protein [Verrucomicrobiales bacterium]|nr:PEP-CTERM sorting domain-containing protein [Verrucomicrobiales bacterium]